MFPLLQELPGSALGVKSFCTERGFGPYKYQCWDTKCRNLYHQGNFISEKGIIPVLLKNP